MDVLAGALRDALLNVRPDGRVPRAAAARVRSAILARQRQGTAPPIREIVGALPAFDTLSADARRSLNATVFSDDSWSMWFRRATWRQVLTRTVRTAGRRIPARYGRLRRVVELGEFLFLYWQARLVHMLYRKALAWRGWNSREPPLAALLAIAGLDARTLASSYLRELPQPLETCGYWHDAARQTTVGVVVGIDFIVNDEGVWFVESNLNVGLMEERSRMYETDPFVTGLVRFARRNGYTSMVFLACNDVPVDDIMAGRIEQAALAAGLRATVLEDRYAPQRRLAQTFLVPALDERTLVVRSKMFHTSFDAIFHHKVLSLDALEAYQKAFGDRDVRVPSTGENALSDSFTMDGPFPNLVCKFPERDQGQGVIFMKVQSLARARAIIADPVEMNRHSVANVWTKLRYRLKLEDQTAVFQSYVPSTLLEGRRLSIARAQVLATPVGIEFLSAHRVVSNLPVPESLAEGLVEDSKPYIVNYSLDSQHAPMPPDEERRVSLAALSVVRALCWSVEARYQTRPDQDDRERRDRPA
jgi:hypothetical protein